MDRAGPATYNDSKFPVHDGRTGRRHPRRALIDPRHRRVSFCARAVRLGCAGALLASSLSCRSSPPAPSLERAIAAGESRAYDLTFPPGRYLSLSYRQIGLEIEAVLADPAGRVVAVAGRGERRTRKRLDLVTAAAGRYRLTLTGRDAAGSRGRFRLDFEELRRAEEPQDGLRVAARAAFSEALRIADAAGNAASRDTLSRLERAGLLWRQAGDCRGEVDADNAIGNALLDQNSPRALEEIRATLSRAEACGYPEGRAKALEYLGIAWHQDRGDPEHVRKSRETTRQALALWRDLGDIAEQAEALSNLAYLESFDGPPDVKAARADYRRALSLRRAAGDVDGEANTLNGLGLLETEATEAVKQLEAARRLAQRSPNRETEVSIVSNLAGVYQKHGNLQAALDRYDEALQASHLGTVGTQVSILHNVGSLYVELGDLERALDVYRRVLRLDPSSEEALQAQVNMGYIRYKERDLAAAGEAFRNALELSRKRRLTRPEASVHAGLAHIAMDQGDGKLALGHLQAALALTGAERNADPTDEAQLHLASSRAYGLLHDPAGAARELDWALPLAQAGGRPAVIANCLRERALFHRASGALEAARNEVEQGLQYLERELSEVASDDLRVSFFATQRSFYDLDVDLLVRLDRAHPGGGFAAAALAASDWSRARALLDLLAEGRVDVRGEVSGRLAAEETALAQRLAGVRAELAAAADSTAVRSAQSELAQLAERRDRLAAGIRRENPRYASVRYPVRLTAPQIQSLLGRETALLEYFLGAESAYLFVVTDREVTAYDLGGSSAIDSTVASLRQALERPGGKLLGSYRRQAARLYRLLLPGGAPPARNLLIVPDGSLHLLPFEVLLTDAAAAQREPLSKLPYLLRDHVISYVPSAAVLKELPPANRPRQRSAAADSLVAYAPSAADDAGCPAPPSAVAGAIRPAILRLPPLRGSRREIEAIGALYRRGSVTLYCGSAASKSNVLGNRALAGAHHVHFAMHGISDAEHPELSGLVLWPAGPRDDGILGINDIFNLKLSADLVVLSACETGLGKRVSGEGLVGLARAFFYAGAPSLVVSLWQVSEDTAPDFMPDFYARLGRGDDKGEALRQAKLAMIAGERRAHPFYWAPFILSGDPR